jgi:hypothetical protein
VSEYVRTLEERIDAENEIIRPPAELPAAENLVQDVEEFLRRSSQGPNT